MHSGRQGAIWPSFTRERYESTGQGTRGTRYLAAGRTGTLRRTQRRAHQGAPLGDLRHRHAHIQLGCLGAENRPRAHGRRPRILRGNRRAGQRSARLQHRRSRIGRRPHHLRALPQLPGRPAASVPQHLERGREPPRGIRRISDHSGDQRVQIAARHRRRNRIHSRSVRQRHAHGAGVQRRRRGCADHRRRPHRHHGGGDCQALRRAAHRHHGRERLSAWTGRKNGCIQSAQCVA